MGFFELVRIAAAVPRNVVDYRTLKVKCFIKQNFFLLSSSFSLLLQLQLRRKPRRFISSIRALWCGEYGVKGCLETPLELVNSELSCDGTENCSRGVRLTAGNSR